MHTRLKRLNLCQEDMCLEGSNVRLRLAWYPWQKANRADGNGTPAAIQILANKPSGFQEVDFEGLLVASIHCNSGQGYRGWSYECGVVDFQKLLELYRHFEVRQKCVLQIEYDWKAPPVQHNVFSRGTFR